MYVKSISISSNISSQKVAALSVAFHPNSELKRLFIGGSDGVIRCVQWVCSFYPFDCVFVFYLHEYLTEYRPRDLPDDWRYCDYSPEGKACDGR